MGPLFGFAVLSLIFVGLLYVLAVRKIERQKIEIYGLEQKRDYFHERRDHWMARFGEEKRGRRRATAALENNIRNEHRVINRLRTQVHGVPDAVRSLDGLASFLDETESLTLSLRYYPKSKKRVLA